MLFAAFCVLYIYSCSSTAVAGITNRILWCPQHFKKQLYGGTCQKLTNAILKTRLPNDRPTDWPAKGRTDGGVYIVCSSNKMLPLTILISAQFSIIMVTIKMKQQTSASTTLSLQLKLLINYFSRFTLTNYQMLLQLLLLHQQQLQQIHTKSNQITKEIKIELRQNKITKKKNN